MNELRQYEQELKKQLESLNLSRGKYYETHQTQVLSATHFLKLYHESSSKLLKMFEVKQQAPIKREYLPLTKENVLQSLEKGILQSTWDSLHEKDFLSAYLKFQFAITNYKCSESYDYFLDRLKDEITSSLYTFENDTLFLASILNLPFEPKTGPISALQTLKHLSVNFKVPVCPKITSLFPDYECNDLQNDIETSYSTVQFNPSYVSELYTKIIKYTIESTSSEETLNEIATLDPSFASEINEIIKSREDANRKTKIEGSRDTISALLDRIFKNLQGIIRSTQTSQIYLEDISHIICDEEILGTFNSSVTNKVNILLTLYRNTAKSEDILVRLYRAVKYFQFPEATHSLLESFLMEKFGNVFLIEWKDQVRHQLSLHLPPYAQAWLSNLILEHDIQTEHVSCFITPSELDNLFLYGLKPFVKTLPVPQSPKQEPTQGPIEYFVKK